MLKCKFVVDGTDCTTEQYQANPEQYQGQIYCKECNERAYFIRSYSTSTLTRMACFGARHANGCTASTVSIGVVDEDDEQLTDDELQSADLLVDLDKSSANSIYVSAPTDIHGEEESTWMGSGQQKQIGGSSGYPTNKSLRQLLANLCKNENFADKGQTIKIVADSGRVVLDGLLSDYLLHFKDISHKHAGKLAIYWGTINNTNYDDTNEVLWLNYGNYRTEPSIRVSESLKQSIITNFKLDDISELDGADVLIVGSVGISGKGKAVIQTGFTKYMSFRRMEVKYGLPPISE
jgi:hypothetical protein